MGFHRRDGRYGFGDCGGRREVENFSHNKHARIEKQKQKTKKNRKNNCLKINEKKNKKKYIFFLNGCFVTDLTIIKGGFV